MIPDELRNLIDRHAQLRSELRDLHAGRTVAGDIDPVSRERQLPDSLQAIEAEIAENQIQG